MRRDLADVENLISKVICTMLQFVSVWLPVLSLEEINVQTKSLIITGRQFTPEVPGTLGTGTY